MALKKGAFKSGAFFINFKLSEITKTTFHTVCKRFNSQQLTDESTSFSKFAEGWWNINGEMRALHSLNELRVPFIRDCLLYQGQGTSKTRKPLQNVSILDVGCGVGVLSEPLARLGANVVGIDTSNECLQVAQKHRDSSVDNFEDNLQYVECPVEDLVTIGALKFDCVVASEVIEHIPDPKSFLKNCCDLIKPGGSLIVSTINRNMISYFLAVLMAENVFHAAPKGTHQYEKFVKPEEIANWAQEENCYVSKIHGMTYLPPLDKWIWIDKTQVNYILHAVKDTSNDTNDTSNED